MTRIARANQWVNDPSLFTLWTVLGRVARNGFQLLALSKPGAASQDVESEELRAALLASAPEPEGTTELENIIATEKERAASSRIGEAEFSAGLQGRRIPWLDLQPRGHGMFRS